MHRDHVKIMEFQWCIGTVQVYRFSAGDGIVTGAAQGQGGVSTFKCTEQSQGHRAGFF